MAYEEPQPPAERHDGEAPSRFPTTRWTLIQRIAEGSPSDRESALEEVCLLYWPPVLGYFRSRGADPHTAEDLTQGLFAQLLKGHAMERLEPARGKLRAYLLAMARNYYSDERRRAERTKRGGGVPALSLDLGAMESISPWIEEAGELPPDRAFERLWAATVLETAFATTKRRYGETGRAELFEVLAPCIRVDADELDRKAAAKRLGMPEAHLRVALHRLRRSYGEALRKTVAETLAPGEDVEEELRRLRAVFA